MTMNRRLQIVSAVVILLAAIPAVRFGMNAYEERQKILAMDPSDLPGTVLYFTSPG